jgi:hypothetical protein
MPGNDCAGPSRSASERFGPNEARGRKKYRLGQLAAILGSCAVLMGRSTTV